MRTIKVTPELFKQVKTALDKPRKNSNHRTIGHAMKLSETTVKNISRFVDYNEYRDYVTKQTSKIKQPSKQLKLTTVKKFANPLVIETGRGEPTKPATFNQQIEERLTAIEAVLRRLDTMQSIAQDNFATMLTAQHIDYINSLKEQLAKKKVIW